jgi:thioredoxin-like negative regulator of GroEL
MVTIEFDPNRANAKTLTTAITKLGYEAQLVQAKPVVDTARKADRVPARLPDDAPAFFRNAFKRARDKQRPIILSFAAAWCPACVRLKKETLSAPQVLKSLGRVEFIPIDLDKHPSLGKAYGVEVVPNVFLIDSKGLIVDRLQDFEPPKVFLTRLEELLRN